jgi:peptidyl carrier protein
MTNPPHSDPRLAEIEGKVEEIWNRVLKVSAGMRDATFFMLNGESISAVRIVSWIEEELGILVDVADIFEDDPNLPEFSRTVVAKAKASPSL